MYSQAPRLFMFFLFVIFFCGKGPYLADVACRKIFVYHSREMENSERGVFGVFVEGSPKIYIIAVSPQGFRIRVFIYVFKQNKCQPFRCYCLIRLQRKACQSQANLVAVIQIFLSNNNSRPIFKSDSPLFV